MKALLAILSLGIATISSNVVVAAPTDAELDALGQSFAQAINERNGSALDSLISAPHLARKIVEIAGDGTGDEQELLNEFRSQVGTVGSRMLVELERQDAIAVYLRIHEFDGMRGPLVRCSIGGGYNYMLLLPVRSSRGEEGARISDIYLATSGERISETIGITTKLVSSPSESFLGRLFGIDQVNTDLVTRFQRVARLRQEHRLQEAFDVLDQIEGSVRNHRIVVMNTLQIASQLDDDLYVEELRRLGTHHKDDPRVAFTLLDYYFFENDLDEAMAIIDVMEKSYGEDGVFALLRANVEFSRGDLEAAQEYARRSVQLEPDNEDGQWTLLNALVHSGKHAESITVLDTLQDRFGYAFIRADFAGEPIYAEFIESDEFVRWID